MQTMAEIFNGTIPGPALVTQYNDSLWAMSIQAQVLSAQVRDLQMSLVVIIVLMLVMLFAEKRQVIRK